MLFKPRQEIIRGEALKVVTKPLFPICRAMGILPYADDFSVSSFWLKYSLVLNAVVIVVTTVLKLVLVFVVKPTWLPNMFDNLLFMTEGFIESAGFVAHAVSLIVYRQDYEKVLLGLRDLTDHKSTNVFIKYAPIVVIFKLITVFLKQLVMFPLDWNYEDILFYIVHVPNTMFYFISLVFCSTLELLRHQINVLIKDLRPLEQKLVPMTKKHHSLVDLAVCLNDIFSWQLLIMCTRIFLKLVSSLYACILNLKEGNTLEVIDYAWVCVWQIILLFSLSISCEETKDKAEGFSNELFKLMRESKDLCSNEKLHLYVSMRQTVNFTACGFFTLGYPLVTSIIAAATTYLVILVQFSMQDKEN